MSFSSSLPLLLNNTVFRVEVLLPLGLILLDIITGILSSVKGGTFDLAKLPQFLSGDLLKYAGSCFLILLAWVFQGSALGEQLTAALGMGVLTLSVAKSVVANAQEMFRGDALAETVIDEVAALAGVPVVPQSPAVPVSMAGLPAPLPVSAWVTNEVPIIVPLIPNK